MDKHPKLKAYSFMINNIKKDVKHLLSDDVEDVIAKLNISAGMAWSNMQSYLTSISEVEYRGKILQCLRFVIGIQRGFYRKEGCVFRT